jgi:hypothetical protein
MIAIGKLKEFTFFKDFSNDQLIKLEPLAVEETHQAGTQLYSNGDAARSLYLLEEGKVALFMDNYMGPGKPPMQVTIDIITRGNPWAGRPSWSRFFIP